MPSSRGCRSSYDCIVKIKGVTTRPILFSQLMRSDGEGAMNLEELFADDRSPASERERVHEDELHSLMRNILDWAISFLSEPSQGTIRAIYFEGKTVKQHSEEEYVTVYAIYKRRAPGRSRRSSGFWPGARRSRAGACSRGLLAGVALHSAGGSLGYAASNRTGVSFCGKGAPWPCVLESILGSWMPPGSPAR